MATIRWLRPDDGPEAIPSAEEALLEPNGLLAAGGSLAPEWLLASYSRGIFPWYEEGQPILWWSPDPRAVVTPNGIHVSRTLAKTIRRNAISVTCDEAFAEVIAGCAEPRSYTDKTWITPEMAAAYTTLHNLGHAHSFEARIGEDLVGGLYGVALGQVFFGESMFARVSNASKAAFAVAGRFLSSVGIALIDCQLPSAHLRSLGATDWPRTRYLEALSELTRRPTFRGPWTETFRSWSNAAARNGSI